MHGILLVEDEDVLRRSLERFLSGDDRRVRSVSERAQASTLLASGAFDLLVTDLVLPDGSGTELVEDARGRGMDVIVITAYGSLEVRARLAAQSVAWIAKPFDLELLRSAVVDALSRRCARLKP